MTPRRPDETISNLDEADEGLSLRRAVRRGVDPRKRRHVLAWIDALLEEQRLKPGRGAPNHS